MRYPATEKLEIILLIEQSHLPAKRTGVSDILCIGELVHASREEQG